MDKGLQKGTLWTIIFFLSSFAKTIILTPLMLKNWGVELFGFWAIILSARAIILFLSDGYVRYIVNQYNITFHTNTRVADVVLVSGLSFLLVFSFLICFLMGTAFIVFPRLSQIIFNTQNAALFSLCLLVYLLAASLQNLQRMFAATSEARGLVWQNLRIEVLVLLLELPLLAWLLLGAARFSTVLFIDAALIGLVSLIYTVYLARRYHFSEVYSLQSLRVGAQHFWRATHLYGSNFFEKLSSDGLVLILSFFRFDKAAIALFATVRTLINTPLLAQNLLLNTYSPQVQKDFAQRNVKGLAKLFWHIRVRVGYVLLAGIVCCYPLYEPVFVLWTKGRIAYQQPFMMIMLLLAVCNLYGLSFAFVFKALNILPQLFGIMVFKLAFIIVGMALVGTGIESLAWVLAMVEAVVSFVLLPILLQRYWRKEALPLTTSFQSTVGYLLAALVLFSFYLFQP